MGVLSDKDCDDLYHVFNKGAIHLCDMATLQRFLKLINLRLSSGPTDGDRNNRLWTEREAVVLHAIGVLESAAKRDAREEETLSIARLASRRADRANLIAWIAAIIAAMSIAKDIAIWYFK